MVLNELSVTFIILTGILKHSKKVHLWTNLNTDHIQIRNYVLYHFLWNLTRRDKHAGLNMDQLTVTLKNSFKEALIDSTRRWVKDIFILNNRIE